MHPSEKKTRKINYITKKMQHMKYKTTHSQFSMTTMQIHMEFVELLMCAVCKKERGYSRDFYISWVSYRYHSVFSPNSMENSKNYSLLMWTTYFFHRTLFYQAFHNFLLWWPSCTCTIFSSRTLSKLSVFVPNTVKVSQILWFQIL